MKTTLRHLDVYRALMLHRSVSRAAEALNLTQPAVTKTLANLEDRLGLKLFDRGRHGCIPTAEGEQLFQFVDKIFDIHSGFERVADDLRNLRSGHLRIVANPALSLGLLSRIVAEFRHRHPATSLMLRTVPARLIPEMVGSHQVDLGLVLFPFADETTHFETLGHGHFCCAVPPGHLFATMREVPLSAFDDETYLSFTPQMTYRRLLDSAFKAVGSPHSPSIEVESSATACTLARELGIPAIVDNFVVLDGLFAPLVTRPLAPSPAIEVGACFPKLRPLSSLAAAFLDSAREVFPSLP